MAKKLFKNPESKKLTPENMFVLPDGVNSKYCQRVIMSGGPLITPDKFFQLIPKPTLYLKLSSDFGDLKNLSLSEGYFSPKSITNIDELAAMIFNGGISLPIVYKPNFSGVADGIMFIEKHEKGLEITVKRYKEIKVEKQNVDVSEAIKSGALYYLEKLQEIESNNPNIHKGLVETEKNLIELLEYASVSHLPTNNKKGRFDVGMVESFMGDTIKYKDCAYETRHQVSNFLDVKDRDFISTKDLLARKGSSSYFSNHFAFKGSRIMKKNMYQPIFEEFNMNEGQQKEFTQHVSDVLIDTLVYSINRLSGNYKLESGFCRNTVIIDLMWKKINNSNFPKPVLIEYELNHYLSTPF